MSRHAEVVRDAGADARDHPVVADYLGVDVTLVRLVTVLGAVFGLGSLVVAYVVAWILLPEA